MKIPLLFLDLDGVVNGHEWNEEAESTTFIKSCVTQLNRIIHTAKPDVVLSSAWRYMILNGAMNLLGFHHLLRSHGVTRKINLIGTTKPDEAIPTRGGQIQDWLKLHGKNYHPFVVVDDLDLDISPRGLPFVQTVKKVGLTVKDADRIISMLLKG